MCKICEAAKRLQGHGMPKTSDLNLILIHMRELRIEVEHYRRIYGTTRVEWEYEHGIQSMQILCKRRTKT